MTSFVGSDQFLQHTRGLREEWRGQARAGETRRDLPQTGRPLVCLSTSYTGLHGFVIRAGSGVVVGTRVGSRRAAGTPAPSEEGRRSERERATVWKDSDPSCILSLSGVGLAGGGCWEWKGEGRKGRRRSHQGAVMQGGIMRSSTVTRRRCRWAVGLAFNINGKRRREMRNPLPLHFSAVPIERSPKLNDDGISKW